MTCSPRPRPQLLVVVGGHQKDRHGPLAVDLGGRIQAVHVSELDVGDDQVRGGKPAQVHQLPSRLGRHDLMAQARQQFLQILPHVRFIVGGDDPQGMGHGILLGNAALFRTGIGSRCDADPARVGIYHLLAITMPNRAFRRTGPACGPPRELSPTIMDDSRLTPGRPAVSFGSGPRHFLLFISQNGCIPEPFPRRDFP